MERNWDRLPDGTVFAFWVEEPIVRLHVRVPGDADPTGVVPEVSARAQAFAARSVRG